MIGIVTPSPYDLQSLWADAPTPGDGWPRDYALTASPGSPLYDLAPGERPQIPNAYNAAIDQLWALWHPNGDNQKPSSTGTGTGTGNNSGTGNQQEGYGNSLFSAYANNPIDMMPDNGLPLHFAAAIDTPAPGTSDTQVIAFVVPDGWIAVIKATFNSYQNNAFQEGSGDLIWRIDIDGTYAPGFDAITTTLGSVQYPRPIIGAMIATSGQTVRYTVSVDAGTGIPTGSSVKVICGFDGYFVPELL